VFSKVSYGQTKVGFSCDDYYNTINNPVDPKALMYLICPVQSIINIGLGFVGASLILMILYGAVKLVMANGDPKQLEGARLVWTWAFFGALVVLFSIVIVNIVFRVFGTESTPLRWGLDGNLGGFFDRMFDSLQNLNQ
jgi:hypothetical protein